MTELATVSSYFAGGGRLDQLYSGPRAALPGGFPELVIVERLLAMRRESLKALEDRGLGKAEPCLVTECHRYAIVDAFMTTRGLITAVDAEMAIRNRVGDDCFDKDAFDRAWGAFEGSFQTRSAN